MALAQAPAPQAPVVPTIISIWLKLAALLMGVELYTDVVWIVGLAVPFEPEARRLVVTIAIAATTLASGVGTVRGFRLQPATPRPSRRQILSIILGGTIGTLVGITAIALLWLPVLPFGVILLGLWILAIVSLGADALASGYILR